MPEQVYPWQAPFVGDVGLIESVRRGNLDLYAADGGLGIEIPEGQHGFDPLPPDTGLAQLFVPLLMQFE